MDSYLLGMLCLVLAFSFGNNGIKHKHVWKVALIIPLFWLALYFIGSIWEIDKFMMRSGLFRPAFAMFLIFLLLNSERERVYDLLKQIYTMWKR